MNTSDCQNSRGLIICVSGPSGVGKGTVIRRVLALQPAMVHSISVTTRLPRPGETDGVEYFFRSKAAFAAMQAAGEILESDTYCGHDYGTPRRSLEQLVESGRDILLDITVPGSLAVMRVFPEAVTIFLLPPSLAELTRRLGQRGTESPGQRQARLDKARDEISQAGLFNYLVVNDDLNETAAAILAIARAERHRYERCAGIETTVLLR
jgi:guanylate kinase